MLDGRIWAVWTSLNNYGRNADTALVIDNRHTNDPPSEILSVYWFLSVTELAAHL